MPKKYSLSSELSNLSSRFLNIEDKEKEQLVTDYREDLWSSILATVFVWNHMKLGTYMPERLLWLCVCLSNLNLRLTHRKRIKLPRKKTSEDVIHSALQNNTKY